ncbi:MAG: hypothetical protein WA981_16210 [Glaciecola sp.]
MQREDVGIGDTNKMMSVAQFGVSDQLRAEFDMLRDVSIDHGSDSATYPYKFTQKSVDMLARQVVCRNYGNACYELSHLCWLIIHTQQDASASLVNYFWLRNITNHTRFIEYFSGHTRIYHCNVPNAEIHFSQAQITLKLHQHQFTVSASRANYLACLIEWLMCVIHDLNGLITNTLLGKGFNAICELSSVLQSKIYQHIGAHLPTAKLLQRYRLLEHWYNSNNAPVNDDNILLFWRDNNTLEGQLKYDSVVHESMSYLLANEQATAHQAVSFADNIEDNHEAIYDITAQYVSDIDIHSLTSEPKVFTQSQVDFVSLFTQYSPLTLPLCHTFLRSQSFGKWQNKIIQASRKQNAGLTTLPEFTEADYSQLQEQLMHVIATCHQALLAIVHVVSMKNAHSGAMILTIISEVVPALKPHSDKLHDLLEANTDSGFTIENWRQTYPWFDGCYGLCEKASKQIKRSGFTHDTRLDDEQYSQAVTNIMALSRLLTQHIKKIVLINAQSEDNFAADRFIFSDEFMKLHIKDE